MIKILTFVIGSLLWAAMTVAPAQAVTVSIVGDTTGAPTWNRIHCESGCNRLFHGGYNVPYDVIEFTVDLAGDYRFEITEADFDTTGSDIDDTYIVLYEEAFDPDDPYSNNVNYNDDFVFRNSNYLSRLAQTLEANRTYFIIVTGYDYSAYGTYTLEISGPGAINVSSVPLPTALPLYGAGLAVMGFIGWRKKRWRGIHTV